MKYIGENEILRRIFHEVSRFPIYFTLYRGKLYYFLDSVEGEKWRSGGKLNISLSKPNTVGRMENGVIGTSN